MRSRSALAVAGVAVAPTAVSEPKNPVRPAATPPAKVTIASTGTSTTTSHLPYPPERAGGRSEGWPLTGVVGTAKPTASDPGTGGSGGAQAVASGAGGSWGAGTRSLEEESVMGSFGWWALGWP